MASIESIILVVLVFFALNYLLYWIRLKNEKESLEKSQFHFTELEVEECVVLGFHYLSEKSYEKALTFLSKAISIEPHARIYAERAKIQLKLKSFERAIVDYTQAIRLSPLEAEFYSNRGKAYYEIEAFAFAEKDWLKASKLGCHQSGYFLTMFNDRSIKEDFYNDEEPVLKSEIQKWN
jgi:tetratricopeptide (TPR) repeat protein